MGVKKFMQVEFDVKCIQINFGGHGLSGFRDIALLKIWPKFLLALANNYMPCVYRMTKTHQLL